MAGRQHMGHNSTRPPVGRMRIHFAILPEEVDITTIRAQDSGGQNVNKMSNAVHLRFDIAAREDPRTPKIVRVD